MQNNNNSSTKFFNSFPSPLASALQSSSSFNPSTLDTSSPSIHYSAITLASISKMSKVNSAYAADDLFLTYMHASESICDLYSFQMHFISKNAKLDVDKQVAKPLSVAIANEKKERFFSGVATSFSVCGILHNAKEVLTQYQAIVRPQFFLLTLSKNFKIFQEQSAADIIKKVLKDANIDKVKYSLTKQYVKRDYCVQYNESDFDFVSRLMEEEGIFYFFEHNKNEGKLIITDDKSAYISIDATKFLHASSNLTTITPGVMSFSMTSSVLPNKYQNVDYNYEKSQTKLVSSTKVDGKVANTIYDFPGYFLQKGDGDKFAAIRAGEIEVNKILYSGVGNNAFFSPGCLFKLEKHNNEKFNAKYVIYKTEHVFNAFAAFCENSSSFPSFLQIPFQISSQPVLYKNSFICFSDKTKFYPPRKTIKPLVQGIETAVVTGPKGEEICIDKLGRIKVQFFWDQLGKNDDKTTCWMRVIQSFAGSSWGGLFTPRIGQEVVVQFVNGNPDRPVVTGALYNDKNTPPYDDKKPTISTIKTNSTKDAKGFNEIRFDDLKEKEEIFMHAQKDMKVHILNSRETVLGGSFDKLTLDHSSYFIKLSAGKDPILKEDGAKSDGKGANFIVDMVKGDYKFTITEGNSISNLDKGNMSITLKDGNSVSKIKGDYTLEVDGNINIKATGNISINSDKKTACCAKDDFSIEGKNVNQTSKEAFSIKAGKDCKMQAQMNIDIKSSMVSKITAGTDLKMSGLKCELKGSVDVSIQGGAKCEVKSGAMLDLKGAMINVKGAMVAVGAMVKLG